MKTAEKDQKRGYEKMENNSDISEERKFLHDIATPMTVIRLHCKRLLKICNERQGSEVEAKLLEQILDSVKSMETMHANRKAGLHEEKAS